LAGFSEPEAANLAEVLDIQIPHWPVSAGGRQVPSYTQSVFKFLIGRFQHGMRREALEELIDSNSSLAGFSPASTPKAWEASRIQIPHWPVSAKSKFPLCLSGYLFKFLIGRFQLIQWRERCGGMLNSNSSLAGFSHSLRHSAITFSLHSNSSLAGFSCARPGSIRSRTRIQIPHWPVSAGVFFASYTPVP